LISGFRGLLAVTWGQFLSSDNVSMTSTHVAGPLWRRGQTKDCLAKMDKLLAMAGTDKSRLLTGMIWVKNMEEDFKIMNEVGSSPGPRPKPGLMYHRMPGSCFISSSSSKFPLL